MSLDVPNYRDSNIQLTPPLIRSTGRAIDAAVGLNVLRGLVPFQPTTVRHFAATDSLRSFAVAHSGHAETPATVDVHIDGKSVRQAILEPRITTLGRRQATVDMALSLAT